jgi:hypothetical protein
LRRTISSHVSLAISLVALFVALGGTALAVTQIGTSQIKNNAVTSSKLANNAVSNKKVANNAITSAKVKDKSLKASDIAPNTFLAANGRAADSAQLGGNPPSAYIQGSGRTVSSRVTAAAGAAPVELLDLGFGQIDGSCSSTDHPSLRYLTNVNNVEVVDWATAFGSPNGTAVMHTLNGLTPGTFDQETNPAITPESVTWQASTTDGSHIATAWTSGQFISGTGCVFIGQGLTTG